MKFFRALSLLLSLGSATFSFGRWAAVEDSEATIDNIQVDLQIQADGSFEYTLEQHVTIRNEEGRQRYSNHSMPYTPETTRVKVEMAKTITQGKVSNVDSDLIEDKAFASSANGFDQVNQLTIAYPAVEVGSQLQRRFRVQNKKARFPGFFSTKEILGNEVFTAKAEYRFRSVIPLFVETNDPKQLLEVVQRQEGKQHWVEIRLRAPAYSKAIDEKEPYLLPQQETWFVVSTSKSYADLPRTVQSEYDAVLTAKLPPNLEAIAEAAAKETTSINQINAVTSRLQDAVRYLGDWRTIKGGFIPRPLALVASTRFGDCKDYSAMTAAILRRLGFSAHIAWVYRGTENVPLPKLAYDSAFNHAIVWAQEKGSEGKPGRIFWVDTTNQTSFAQGIYEDISGRDALVLDSEGGRLEKIPPAEPSGSKFIREFEGRRRSGGEFELKGTVQLTGRAAVPVTGLSNRLSKDMIRYAITQALAGDRLVVESQVPDYDLSSRIVKDLTMSGTLRIRNSLLNTTAGPALEVESEGFRFLMDLNPRGRVAAAKLSMPAEQTTRFIMKDARVVGSRNLNCAIISPWMDTSLLVRQIKKDIQITTTTKVKQPYLTVEDIRSVPFVTFQRKLQQCLYATAVVFR